MSNNSLSHSSTTSTNKTLYVFPSVKRTWSDFTTIHKKEREKAERCLKQYFDAIRGVASEAPSLVVAGGFGSGKTQLLFHLFKYSWSQGIPALYVTLRNLLNKLDQILLAKGVRGKLQPKDFADYVTKMAFSCLEMINESYRQPLHSVDELWLPALEGRPSKIPLHDYFAELDLNVQTIKNIVEMTLRRRNGVVVLVDEVEMAFNDLREKIGGGVVLRELTDVIGRLEVGSYIVMAVGYLSYYELFIPEFTGEIAHTRRVELVQLPPIDPGTMYAKIGEMGIDPKKANTLWWLTRGRLGWVNFLKNAVLINDADIGELLSWTKQRELDIPMAEGLRVFDTDELERRERSLCGASDTCKSAIRNFILNLSPRSVQGLPDFVRNELQRISPMLLWCRELKPLDEVISAFEIDIRNFCRLIGMDVSDSTLEIIKRSLQDVLSAFSLRTGSEERLCIGAPDYARLKDDIQNYVRSVFDITMTYIAENFESSESTEEAIELLYYMVNSISEKDKWGQNFQEIKELFSTNIGREFTILAPWELENFVPMYLSNPIISRDPSMTLSKLEQTLTNYYLNSTEDELEDLISGISEFILGERARETLSDLVFIIPYPRPHYANREVKEKVVKTLKRIVSTNEERLKLEKNFLYIYITNIDDSLLNDLQNTLTSGGGLLNLLIEKLGRIKTGRIPGERMSDFVKSLFLLLAEERRKDYTATMEGAIHELRADQKRRVEYFRTTLSTWLNDSIRTGREEYNDRVKDSRLKSLVNLVNILESVRSILERGAKWRPSIKLYATLFITLPDSLRSEFDKMRASLTSGAMIKFRSLPSVYQEFQVQRRVVRPEITRLLSGSPLLNLILQVATEDIKDKPLSDGISQLEEHSLPLYNDFAEILSRTFGIERTGWEKELQILYRTLLLYAIIAHRKDEIINMFEDKYKRVEGSINRLSELLNDIDNLTQKISERIPVNLSISFGRLSRGVGTSLSDELTGILQILEKIKTWAYQLKEGYSEGEDLLGAVAFVTLFGLPEEQDLLLNQLEERLRKWHEELHESVYNTLNELDETLSNTDVERVLTEPPEQRIPLQFNISSIEDVENVGREINELTNEIDKLVAEYKGVKQELQEGISSLKQCLGEIKQNISNLKELLTGGG